MLAVTLAEVLLGIYSFFGQYSVGWPCLMVATLIAIACRRLLIISKCCVTILTAGAVKWPRGAADV